MRIGLISESSQAVKNELVYTSLKKVCDEKGFELFNYGMLDETSPNLSYVQAGLLNAILINSKAVDFIVTGCGNGQGVMLSTNSFPNMFCGLIPHDTMAYLFAQINNGNAISLPLALDFNYAADLKLDSIFRALFKDEFGIGYPKERGEIMRTHQDILKNIKNTVCDDFLNILKNIDKNYLIDTINRDNFNQYFYENAKDEKIKEYLKSIL